MDRVRSAFGHERVGEERAWCGGGEERIWSEGHLPQQNTGISWDVRLGGRLCPHICDPRA
jgi:hypothetical protein